MVFKPKNILVLDFGQLGDAVLSFPALRFIRERFPNALITVMAGQPAAQVIQLSRYADATIAVDRVALRDGPKLRSIKQIFQLVRDVRRRGFDFVIDLHSLYETNLLGFLSGAPIRLFGPRPRRSFNFLSNFQPAPPFEDPSKHAVDRYLDVLTPLDTNGASRIPVLMTSCEDDQLALQFLKKTGAGSHTSLVGMFPGAGHPGRRWPMSSFVALAEKLARDKGARSIVFVGPEEQAFSEEIHEKFSGAAIVANLGDISRLSSVLARLDVFVSSSTGPMHLAAAVGTPVVVLYSRLNPDSFTPVGERHRIIFSGSVANITVDDVYNATAEVLENKQQAESAHQK
ncbi:MAG: glycosyltransferase family 9 protein [Acidobacteriota bacterium]|nr:glycosyltransferase family 9 protein [Acidobacteriota bacterium]